MKKIIFYQSNFCQYGGVETMCYNWCWWLRNFFDVTVLYCTGDAERIKKMAKLVKMEKYEEGKEYECDIFIRNSVWGVIPKGIKAKRMIEMRHANYKWLLDKGYLFQQYKDMGIQEIVACGKFVAEMSHEALGDNPTPIINILMPRRQTNKVLHLISITRIDAFKGWHRMLRLADMLRGANIKFDWKIFTNSSIAKTNYEEMHIYRARYDMWDYLADADYTVLLSDSEGLPYTVQESLQYQVPCIVTDVGGCTELIKDGINGYVVPLDMNFDVTKLLNIPKCKEYDNKSLETWLDYLGYKGKIDKEEIIKKYEEEKEAMVRVRAIMKFADVEANVNRKIGDEWICTNERADFLVEHGGVQIIERIEEKPLVVEKKAEAKKELDEAIEAIGEVIDKKLEVEEVTTEPPKAKKPFKKKK